MTDIRVALDTNVLAYAEGCGDKARCDEARRLVENLPATSVLIPSQALGELFRVLAGKSKRSPSGAKLAVLDWADTFEVADSTWPSLQAALDLSADHGLSIWDALIVSAAATHQCRLLLSEDLQAGFTWRGVTIVNPFDGEPNALLEGLLAEEGN